jgi:hypothetical protein
MKTLVSLFAKKIPITIKQNKPVKIVTNLVFFVLDHLKTNVLDVALNISIILLLDFVKLNSISLPALIVE